MKENGLFLASSAFKEEGFDLLRTVHEGISNGFSGVQLFINENWVDNRKIDQLAIEIKNHGLELLIHLPNLPDKRILKACGRLGNTVPEARALIHFKPALKLPIIRGEKRKILEVGWENSMIGSNSEAIEHLERVMEKVLLDRTFMVFDTGRLMYPPLKQEEAIELVRQVMTELKPNKDVLHVADKNSWDGKYQDHWCHLGDKNGVNYQLLPDYRRFLTEGGRVVLEHESLSMAIDSLPSLRPGINR